MIKQKSGWTEQQDAAISVLYQQRHIEDWNEIVRLLKEEYNFPQRMSKDCKERYFSHINTATLKIQWSIDDERQFIRLHDQIGNKWATIAQHLPGKTDNCVKNHFYSKLRKLLRKLNKIIQFYLKKQFRPVDISIMYKIVQAAEQRFKDKPNCQAWVSDECHIVENKMLEFAMFKDFTNENEKQQEIKFNEQNLEDYKQLIKQIYRVSKLYKRKSKKVRNSLIQAPVNSSKKKTKKQTVKAQENQDEYEDNESQQQLYKPKQRLPTTILVRKLHHVQQKIPASSKFQEKNNQVKENPAPKKHQTNQSTRIQVEQGEGIQQLLRTAGILHDEIHPTSKNETKNRKSSMMSQFSGMNMPSPLMTPNNQNNFLPNNLGIDYSPLHSFSSQQVENFLGFSMVNNTANNCVNFTLSEKSSFKSYSQRDPSQIDNPFFDQYSSNNGRMMFPMNFNVPAATNQFQNTFSQQAFGAFQYGNPYYHNQSGQQEQGQSYIAEPKGN